MVTDKGKTSGKSAATSASKSTKNGGGNHKGAKKPKKLSKKDLEFFYDLLIQRRRELLGDVGHMRDEALHHGREEDTGVLSSMPIHMADVGTDNYEQEFMLGLIEGDRQLLREIDWALKKIYKGTYGICEVTGESIGRPRLEAKPWARYCIDYARKIEKGLASPLPLEDLALSKDADD